MAERQLKRLEAIQKKKEVKNTARRKLSLPHVIYFLKFISRVCGMWRDWVHCGSCLEW
jgi:hypothetical protein